MNSRPLSTLPRSSSTKQVVFLNEFPDETGESNRRKGLDSASSSFRSSFRLSSASFALKSFKSLSDPHTTTIADITQKVNDVVKGILESPEYNAPAKTRENINSKEAQRKRVRHEVSPKQRLLPSSPSQRFTSTFNDIRDLMMTDHRWKSEHTVLASEVPRKDIVQQGKYRYYLYRPVGSVKVHIRLDAVSGDPDLYICDRNEYPTKEKNSWRATNNGSDAIEIQCRNRPLFIAVHGFTADCEYRLQLSSKQHVAIVREVPASGHVVAGAFAYFKIKHTEYQGLRIQLQTVTGDPDLYISCTTQYPTPEHCTWKSENDGDDMLTIWPSDRNFKYGWYFIGIGAVLDSDFILTTFGENIQLRRMSMALQASRRMSMAMTGISSLPENGDEPPQTPPTDLPTTARSRRSSVFGPMMSRRSSVAPPKISDEKTDSDDGDESSDKSTDISSSPKMALSPPNLDDVKFGVPFRKPNMTALTTTTRQAAAKKPVTNGRNPPPQPPPLPMHNNPYYDPHWDLNMRNEAARLLRQQLQFARDHAQKVDADDDEAVVPSPRPVSPVRKLKPTSQSVPEPILGLSRSSTQALLLIGSPKRRGQRGQNAAAVLSAASTSPTRKTGTADTSSVLDLCSTMRSLSLSVLPTTRSFWSSRELTMHTGGSPGSTKAHLAVTEDNSSSIDSEEDEEADEWERLLGNAERREAILFGGEEKEQDEQTSGAAESVEQIVKAACVEPKIEVAKKHYRKVDVPTLYPGCWVSRTTGLRRGRMKYEPSSLLPMSVTPIRAGGK